MPDVFRNLVLVVGNFHLIKTVLWGIGKYLKNSGAETIFAENAVFGPNFVQQVIAATNYERN